MYMTDYEAKEFVDFYFKKIKESTNIKELEKEEPKFSIDKKNRIELSIYPKIEFNIQISEIDKLKKEKYVNDKNEFSDIISSKLTDPIAKLLYAMAWKNGDLKKINSIIKGIIDSENKKNIPQTSLVFHQFGKHLANKSNPIIDQHVIRAFILYKETQSEKIKNIREIDTLKYNNHNEKIIEYIKWLNSDEINSDLKKQKDYKYYIDKLLFGVGKTIKISKKSKN